MWPLLEESLLLYLIVHWFYKVLNTLDNSFYQFQGCTFQTNYGTYGGTFLYLKDRNFDITDDVWTATVQNVPQIVGPPKFLRLRIYKYDESFKYYENQPGRILSHPKTVLKFQSKLNNRNFYMIQLITLWIQLSRLAMQKKFLISSCSLLLTQMVMNASYWVMGKENDIENNSQL